MGTILKSSIGQKLLMSLSGFFLIVFLLVHLTANLFLLFGEEAYNHVAHFMEVNPLIVLMQPVLAGGFLLHIIYASILTIQNQRARGPVRYEVVNLSNSSTWASRNMYVLGGLVFVFLCLHMIHFLVPIKFGDEKAVSMIAYEGEQMKNAYLLVTSLFEEWYYALLYVVGAVFLGLHLRHAFWSAFQSMGLSNKQWRSRLEVVGNIFTIVVAGGFAIIPLYFFIAKMIAG